MKISKVLSSILMASGFVYLQGASLIHTRNDFYLSYEQGVKEGDQNYPSIAREYIFTMAGEKPNLAESGKDGDQNNDRLFVFRDMLDTFSVVNDHFREFEKQIFNFMKMNITDDVLKRATKVASGYDVELTLKDGRKVGGTKELPFSMDDLKDKDGSLKRAMELHMFTLRNNLLNNLELSRKDIQTRLELLLKDPDKNRDEIKNLENYILKTDMVISGLKSQIHEQNKKDKDTFTKRRKDEIASLSKDINFKNSIMVEAFSDLAANSEEVTNIILDSTKKDNVKKLLKSLDESLQNLKNTLGNDAFMDMVKFNSDFSTASRLAMLSNSNKDDLALAYAIKNLKNNMFADNNSYVLSNLIKEYTNRFSNDNNLWANIFGAKAYIKDSKSPKIIGLNMGYDKAFDNIILGVYTTYANSTMDDERLYFKSHSYQFGTYIRKFLQNHEIDAKISAGTSRNKLFYSSGIVNQESKYRGKNIKFDLDYGYITNPNELIFVKPIFGLNYEYSTTSPFSQIGNVGFEIHKNSSRIVNAKMALELRTFYNNNYFYVTPGFQKEIYKKTSGLYANFVGSDKEFLVSKDSKKHTHFILQTGANLDLSHNLNLELSLGTKADKNQQIYNATVGLRYKF